MTSIIPPRMNPDDPRAAAILRQAASWCGQTLCTTGQGVTVTFAFDVPGHEPPDDAVPALVPSSSR